MSIVGAENQSEKLISAARRGELEEVRAILANGVDVNFVDQNGKTALHEAVWSENIVKAGNGRNTIQTIYMLSENEDEQVFNVRTKRLAVAVSISNSAIVECLLSAGANPNIVDKNGRTPLHHASIVGHPGIMTSLLMSDANVNIPDANGNTALHLTIETMPTIEPILVLLAAGANLNIRNSHHETAMVKCLASSHHDVLMILLLINEASNGLHKALERLNQISLNEYNAKLTLIAFSYAAAYGHVSLVKKLLEDQSLLDSISNVNESYFHTKAPEILRAIRDTIDVMINKNEEESGNIVSLALNSAPVLRFDKRNCPEKESLDSEDDISILPKSKRRNQC